MPKMKTNKSVKKRFKLTGKGKVKRMRAFKSHILTKKSPKRKRRLRKADIAAPGDARRIRRMLLKGN
jgi:large subunit ribosomal protein L35